MVAYSYKGRFVAPIRVGLGLSVLDLHYELGGYLPGQPIRPKRQTIRANGRRRHARPGETLQLYHGMRTTKCFKIGDGRCVSVQQIKLAVHQGHADISDDGELWHQLYGDRLDTFARDDGFTGWSDMRAFWLAEHDGKHLGPFIGVLIRWEAM